MLLIFDEVITGFRIAAGGAQEKYSVHADITILSKALSAGFPLACFGGSRKIFQEIVNGKVFHGGVFSGNSLVLSAANACLKHLESNKFEIYHSLNNLSDILVKKINKLIQQNKYNIVIRSVGPIIQLYFLNEFAEPELVQLEDYRSILKYTDFEKFKIFQNKLLDHGVYIHPNNYEPWYLSTAHTEEDINYFVNSIKTVLEEIL
jgi:glutamate-1-semialdehyde 2,1-aminomutase